MTGRNTHQTFTNMLEFHVPVQNVLMMCSTTKHFTLCTTTHASSAGLQDRDLMRTQEHFLQRLQILEDREELSCHICDKIFSTPQDKKRHIEIIHYKNVEKQYSCSQCSHVVYSKQALMYHTERQHNDENKVAKVACNYCDKKFHVKHSLNVHVRYAHESTQVKCE